MNSAIFSATDLPQLQLELNAWRERQPGRSRLPATLWEAAALLAQRHGVSQVSQALRLDYYRLKRRINSRGGVAPSSPSLSAPFVEVKLAAPASRPEAVGTVELFDGQQRRLRLETGHDPSFWLALAESFWRSKS